MSADNYYVVRKHPHGGYTYVMGFESDHDPDLSVRSGSPQFSSISDALSAALDEYSEYGVEVHSECLDDPTNEE